MMKSFEKVEYKGGHPVLTELCSITIKIDPDAKTIELVPGFWSGLNPVTINANEIAGVSFDEKSKRSVGKAAAGAIIGGVLTGGVGLLVGGAIGARKKDVSNIYITIRHNDRELDVILKAGKKADDIYASIAAIL
jgi:hypothetical protein